MKTLGAFLVLCLCLLFPAAVLEQTAGVNDADLSGNYAFTFIGVSGSGSIASVYGAVGRFTADGAGNLTNGELDINGVGTSAAAQAFTGTYTIGADHRGVMTFNIGGSTATLAFAMTASGTARFIKFDASGGSGIIGSGSMEKADTTAFSTARIAGDYAYGASGFDNGNNRAAMMTRFTSNGTGVLSNAAGDVNAYGTDYAMNFTAANYAVMDSATGRGTMRIAFTFGGAPDTMNFVFYTVNSGKLFVMENDAVSTATPLLNGVMLQQQVPSGGFSNGSLSGNSVIYLTGHSQCGSLSGAPKAVAGLLTTNGSGALSLTYDENFCSAPNSVTAAPGSYNAAANGRVTMTIGGYSLVGYLVSANQLFLEVSDSNVLFGFGEAQAASAQSNGSITGNYAGVSTDPVSFAVKAFSGEFSGDGASPTGHLTGTEDISDATGTASGASFAATYSISSSPTNGRGTISLTSPSGGSAIAYVISPTRFVAVPMSDPNPTVWAFEQGPGSTSAVTLSSVSLNPTSVTGGTQNSTGTVALSGAAPAGGAVMSLSSSNTGAAGVPSSVTVAAGATSATFTVTTSAVSASTAVTISAVYAGTTRTATLTVNPAAPPPPVTLSSLTVNPATVTGGLESSTGTVTLSGPAPTGGAVVSLSSSNTGAAQVPSSLTIAAGATSATFTVTTSAVTASTTVTISASYAGTTKTALLSVNPLPLPLLTSMTVSPTSVVGGLQSSTGTVRLSAAAPAGGARIALSSNSYAASVPSSVLIPAGATAVSFPVNTSIVLISTSAAISSSYNNSSRSATIAVLL